MPLAFESASHGTVAFGFFNIESDMLLLERCFFFADEFCEKVAALTRSDEPDVEIPWQVHYIARAEDVGDLIGAIRGTSFTGFIGETYRRYPFPQQPEDFKQNPEGFETQAAFAEMVGKYAQMREISLVARSVKQVISIGDYIFTRRWFQELVKYVWLGGMPRWRDDVGPSYVLDMKRAVEQSTHWAFEGIELEQV